MGMVRLVRQHLSAQVEIQCDYSPYKLNCLETLAQQGMKNQMLSFSEHLGSTTEISPRTFFVGPKTAFKWGPKTTIHHALISFLDVVLIENP